MEVAFYGLAKEAFCEKGESLGFEETLSCFFKKLETNEDPQFDTIIVGKKSKTRKFKINTLILFTASFDNKESVVFGVGKLKNIDKNGVYHFYKGSVHELKTKIEISRISELRIKITTNEGLDKDFNPSHHIQGRNVVSCQDTDKVLRLLEETEDASKREETEALSVRQLFDKVKDLDLGNGREYTSTGRARSRDERIKQFALKRASGRCQYCQESPFIGTDGRPYLEEHHVTPLSMGGEDSWNNVVALCPNCHKEVHHGKDRDIIKTKLREIAEIPIED